MDSTTLALALGAVIGLVLALTGAGGGVLAIPLAVIALVSVSGVSAAALEGTLPWTVALPFASGAVLALVMGQLVAGKLNAKSLQRAFAWFTLSISILMLARAFGGFTA